MKTFLLVALCIAISTVVNAGDWSVICDTTTHACPEFPFDALLRGDGHVIVAAGESGFFEYIPETGLWESTPVGTILGLDYNMYTWDVIATGSSSDGGNSIHILHANSTSITKTIPNAQLTRPGCSYVEGPVTCAIGGAANDSPRTQLALTSSAETRYTEWAQAEVSVEPSSIPIVTSIPFFRKNYFIRSQAPYTKQDASNDADAHCFRMTPSRCLKSNKDNTNTDAGILSYNLRFANEEKDAIIQILQSGDIIKDGFNALYTNKTGESDKIPEGFTIASFACGIMQAQMRICMGVGEALGGERGAWIGSVDTTRWFVMTNENAHEATQFYADAGADFKSVRAAASPFIKELHSVTYNLDTRRFYAVGTIIDDNGVTRPALLATFNGGGLWEEEELPASAKNAGELTSVRVTVIDGCGHLTVLGRNVEGGNTFIAHKKLSNTC